MAETKIIYHIDEEETPYLVKLPVPPEKVTLADFKNVLSNRPVHHYKFFFKSMDQDFGVVKEEISDDNAKLPCFNGRVVSWLVLAESSHSDGGSQSTESRTDLPLPIERTGGIGDSRPPSFHPNASSSRDGLDNETGTDSVVSHRRDRHRRKNRETHDDVPRINGHPKLDRIRDPGGYDSASTVMSSELESSSFVDSDEDENTSRLSSSTEQSTSSRLIRKHKRRRRKQKMRQIDRSSSFSSITDSTMSLNIITVTLNMEKYNFLGISIVGQSNDRGDGGIYIGSIMKGGAVAADGRIEPGDMLLQVNDVNFENMSNDDAVRVLREIVSKPGPISLTVAKCWDPTPRSYFTIPRAEPVRPIDPAAWITHTSALTGAYPRYEQEDSPLSVKSDMATIVKVMQLPDSGLEIRDRMWLKITISNAVIGADVVDWLYTHVEGFKERREARKYASSMLKHGYLRHTVNKITFSEQCYYVFGDLCGNVAALNLNEGSSGTSDQDTLAPLPHPAAPWPLGQGYSYQYPLAPPCFPPTYQEPGFSYGSGSAGSQHSEGSKSSGSSRSNREGKRSSGREKDRRSTGSGSGSDRAPRSGGSKNERPLSQHSHHSHSSVSRSQRSHRSSHHSHGPPGLPPLFSLPKIGNKVYGTSGPPGGPPVRELANVPPELTGSRQSFQKAMGNPCEFFVDIM
ncbi:segment polarity protein dishevelled homolog DVL-1 isoform X6 [Xenopus tropicalis]|uniref:Segment polarity protein dishevelled homolog DVL-1 isoform X6 n=1 Tax=Xenopus tropicalis TaxID=8364 RepID=A0A8J0SSJ2_XENTR|nr:segment polarity protein dishevelled homolog DVL-1 isoform X6 [Xenopus tropicalis]|eukprot:XP_012821477.1 PREDICTED: segment polarity protein dishevelled homolog DVL-1 isoform X6 [Xenopus tropicalis]